MSALMAERRDWAEEPRQASLFGALAPQPQREQPAEEGRVVEFPKRADVAPAETDSPSGASTSGDEPASGAAPRVEAPAAGPAAAADSTVAPAAGPVPAADYADAPSIASVEADSAFAAASEFELAAMPEAAAVVDTMPAVEGASALEAEIVVTPEGFAGGTRTPRAAGSPLARPTLDDVMSRVWEGLSTGMPAACPVCRGELQPAASGPRQAHCGSCGTTID